MSTKSNGVRRFALVISSLLAISISIAGCSSEASQVVNEQPKTSQFVISSLQNGEFLTPFGDDPDIGLTLEAITSLSALGYKEADLGKSIEWVKANTVLLKSPGQKAMFIFSANAAGFASDQSVSQTLKELKATISSDGTVADTNNYAYSWVILSLLASGEYDTANRVALKLITNAEINGAYKYVKGDTASFETADVTSFAQLAIQATTGLGSSEDETAKTFAFSKTSKWIQDNLVEGSHFEAYENVDLGGTSFAAMALDAAGNDSSKLANWLAGRISKEDNGIPSPYSPGVSDVFTTVQALLPISSVNLIDVLVTIRPDLTQKG
jgi:hypothetical protein